MTFSSSLIPSWEALSDLARDSRARVGLWKPSEFSAVQHSQRIWAVSRRRDRTRHSRNRLHRMNHLLGAIGDRTLHMPRIRPFVRRILPQPTLALQSGK